MTKVRERLISIGEFARQLLGNTVGHLTIWLSSTCCVIFQTVSECLSRIRVKIKQVVGEKTIVLIDGGIRGGLDVLRALSLGADFVFLGRPFYYGLAALGASGPQHVVDIFKDELVHSMRQTGRQNVENVVSG